MKKGFIGFITNISNELVSQSILDSFIKEQMKKSSYFILFSSF